jgi:putative endonuclease
MMTNQHNIVIYTGVTNNLAKRVFQHQEKIIKGFTSQYNLDKLVYYEYTTDIRAAIAREKQIKDGSRAKKIALIKTMNPEWKDLSDGFLKDA